MEPEREDEAPKFWKSWRKIYVTLLLYWALLLILMILATKILNS